MNINQVKRGRLIDHLQLVVKDFAASKRFYSAVLGVLKIEIGPVGEDYFAADELFVSTAGSKAAHGKHTGYTHLAFHARSKELVDAFYEAGLAAGGKDNGKPGERPYHPGYYAAFLLDPDGNNIEAVYHGPGKYSADALTITF